MFEESFVEKLVHILKKVAVVAVVILYVFFIKDKFSSIFNINGAASAFKDNKPVTTPVVSNNDSVNIEDKDQKEDKENPIVVETPGNEDNNDNGNSENDNSNENSNDAPKPEEKPTKTVENYRVVIAPGSSLVSIANLLMDREIIEDVNEFIKVTEQMKADTKLRSGTFTIPSDATYQQIIKILSGQI